jgi:hypothetical protein
LLESSTLVDNGALVFDQRPETRVTHPVEQALLLGETEAIVTVVVVAPGSLL